MPSATIAKPRTQSKPHTKKQTIKQQSHKLDQPQKPDQKHNHNQQQQQHSWAVVRGLLQTCKHSSNSHTQQNQQQQQEESLKKQKQKQAVVVVVGDNKKSNKKMKCSGSLCSNTKVTHRPDQSQNQTPSPELHKKRSHSSSSTLSSSNINEASSTSSSSNRSIKLAQQNNNNNNDLAVVSSSSSSSLSVPSSSSNSFRGMPFRRFSGCYECRMVVDPVLGFSRSDPSLRPTICSCPHCGQVFMKPENLELHQALRHAVSELGQEDTSKNIVEIIFQSSWAHHHHPTAAANKTCPRIDRVLKIHNTQTTVADFESYRDAVKSRARPAAATRCAADGNELLRFRAAAIACSLGLNGSTALCGGAGCGACAVIRRGFGPAGLGILTTATSGRAHQEADGAGERRAMVVCRVIAGRVKKKKSVESGGCLEEYDSVAAGEVGVYSNLDELYVFNPKAILPCFLVIYSAF